ncbi:hypothetical protein ACLOJK_023522 [Asimina triloba]
MDTVEELFTIDLGIFGACPYSCSLMELPGKTKVVGSAALHHLTIKVDSESKSSFAVGGFMSFKSISVGHAIQVHPSSDDGDRMLGASKIRCDECGP